MSRLIILALALLAATEARGQTTECWFGRGGTNCGRTAISTISRSLSGMEVITTGHILTCRPGWTLVIANGQPMCAERLEEPK